jgi:hypothetical protein
MANDRAHLKNTEELWIAKYRAALKEVSVQQSRFMRVRVGLCNARNIVISQIGRIVNNWIGANPRPQEIHPHPHKQQQRPARSSEPLPISQPKTSIRKRAGSTGKRSSRKGKTAIVGKVG